MKTKANKIILLILAGIFILQLVLIFNSSGIYGGADNINHFRIARYAFNYPWLFLDHWGKPVYTALVFPFTFLGIQFARLFNVFVGLLTVWLTVKTFRLTGEKFNLILIFFIAFSPMYFLLMQSCMTEILFSFVLVLSIFLYLKDKYLWAAIVLSFVPFIRTEGIVVIPLFILVFLWARKFRAIPFLLVGSLFYSLVGYPYYHDWLWIIHQMPYSMGQSLYGSGSIFHFVQQSPNIFGEPFLIFLIIGLIVWTYQVLKMSNPIGKSFLMYFLIVGSFVVFFAAHSYVWWKGTGGSLGLVRVIAGVVPLAAIIAVFGFNAVLLRMKNTSYQAVFTIVVIAVQIVIPFTKNHIPVRLERTQELVLDASKFIKTFNEQSKIYYFDPYLVHFLNLDPFDQSLSNWGVGDKIQASNSLNTGDLLVWDAHFGPNEGGVSLENLLADSHLQRIKTIMPAERFQVLGGYDYGIYIFRKVDQKIIQEKSADLHRELVFGDSGDIHLISVDGKKLLQMDAGMEFCPAIQIPFSEIQAPNYMEILASVRFLALDLLDADEVLLILSVDVDHKPISYNKINLIAKGDNINRWQEISLQLQLSAGFPKGAILNLYVWNKNKQNLLLDNVKLNLTSF
ncbi:MAG TPA: hypothetical protein VFC65_18650 [Prolixibacteraceae bacterium]|nr:hypothetical protein [Prolixibacteraceae bacterium]